MSGGPQRALLGTGLGAVPRTPPLWPRTEDAKHTENQVGSGKGPGSLPLEKPEELAARARKG